MAKTVRDFILEHPDATVGMMTPGGCVYLTPECGKELLAGQSVPANFCTRTIERYIPPEELLPQVIIDCYPDDACPNYYHMLTNFQDLSDMPCKSEVEMSMHM